MHAGWTTNIIRCIVTKYLSNNTTVWDVSEISQQLGFVTLLSNPLKITHFINNFIIILHVKDSLALYQITNKILLILVVMIFLLKNTTKIYLIEKFDKKRCN